MASSVGRYSSSLWHRLRPWMGAACFTCLVASGISAQTPFPRTSQPQRSELRSDGAASARAARPGVTAPLVHTARRLTGLSSASPKVQATSAGESSPVAQPLPFSPASPEGVAGDATLRNLDGRDVACQAARHAMLPEVLRARARTVHDLYKDEDDCTRQAAQALAQFLCLQAKHQEDAAAANALRAYYGRIAVAEQLRLTQQGMQLTDEQRRKQQSLRSSGVAGGVDLSEFDRRELEIQDKQLQLFSQERQLRNLLAQTARLDYRQEEVIQEPLEVCECPLDCDAIAQQAMLLRHDLRGWQLLAAQVNPSSAPVFARMLGTLVGGWGLPMPTVSGLKMLLHPPDHSKLSSNLRREIDLAVNAQRERVVQEVHEKCAKTSLAYERIEIARQVISSWEARLEQLEQLEQLGNAQPEQRAVVRGELLKARGEEISRRLEARNAEIDLAEATGGLSDRCCAGQPWLITGEE